MGRKALEKRRCGEILELRVRHLGKERQPAYQREFRNSHLKKIARQVRAGLMFIKPFA
jgi:hypothetical protein